MSGYMKFPWILFFFILAVPASPARSSTVTAPVQENTRTDTALPVVATPWEELVAEGTQLGMDAGRVKDVLGHLAMAGKSPAESREIFVPIFKMAQQNLPTEILLLKVEEGTEKNVATALIIKAVSLRAQALQAAQSLLRQEGFQLSAHQGGCLIEALTMAFETGVPSSFLVKILRKGKEQRIGKIRACVEASEMFFLAGLSLDSIEIFINDLLEKDMGRIRINRFVRFALKKKQEGADLPTSYASLWKEFNTLPENCQPEAHQDHTCRCNEASSKKKAP